ncbi:alpha-lactalbumin A-like isoform X2 [Helicoverpa armigera]|uniref:alpha-lactalbumin A-like isoform X2 n=1 Tax=Helicoverpa armigera TaxID=29058 RepID=UPI003083160B
MKCKLISIVLLCFVLCDLCTSKTFTRCQLSKELLKIKGIQKTYLGTWVCLIEKVSKRDTSLLTVKASGKKLYGLYQIPKEWCREKKRGGLCNISCEALLDDDIRDDTVCALKIAEEKGFKYWPQWTTRCKNDNFITNEIYKCPDLNRLTPERSLSSSLYSRSLQLRRKRSLRSPYPKVTRSKSRHIH